MNSIFKQLLNVKNTVVEDARIVDSPLRPVAVLEIRVRPRKGMPGDDPNASSMPAFFLTNLDGASAVESGGESV